MAVRRIEGDGDWPRGPWGDRVTFAPGGTFAYRPDEVLVRSGLADRAHERLVQRSDMRGARLEEGEVAGGEFARITHLPDPLEAIEVLRREEGVAAQVNHVLFAASCCPPHPASPEASWYYEEADGIQGKPFWAKPFWAKPFWAKPFYAKALLGGCCCCGSGGGLSGNPFWAKPFWAKPFWAKADPNPLVNPTAQASGRRRSSALPAREPRAEVAAEALRGGPVRVAILDTGWAALYEPSGLPGADITAHGGDEPDEARDGYLDPVAGHGTFIAGVIEQVAPGCELELFRVLSTFGDGDEADVATVLSDLADRPDEERPHLVNLSFGGYSPIGMDLLDDAIARLHRAGSVVVASAGNEATCIPLYPALLPDVVSVAALDHDGDAAPFTNYGPWVRACALGADVVSAFFDGFDGAEPPVDGVDPDHFEGWAMWSGTSFAAPRVVAALAREVAGGRTPQEAVDHLIDADGLERKPMLGTVVE
jgi:hypothetical protein